MVARAVRARPDFLILGTQKAGTTSLHAYLSTHPRLRPSTGPKELHYFNIYYHRGLGWYLSHFPFRLAKGHQLTFEATPDYLWNPAVPARVRAEIGRPKLIVVLRDPAERAYSAWNMWHAFARRTDRDPRRADLRSFSQAIADELASPDNEAEKHFHYVAMGRYDEHLRRWLDCCAPEDMLILEHREMAADLQNFLAKICGFLGVEPFEDTVVRALGGTRHWVGPKRERTAEDVFALDRLRAYYAPYDAALTRLLGRPLEWMN